MGADIIRQASEQSAHQAGDGTSTSAILTEAIASEGMKLIETGYNPISIQRGVISAAKTIANYIKENIKQECSPEQIHQIALVSTNWDKEIAHLVSEAVEKQVWMVPLLLMTAGAMNLLLSLLQVYEFLEAG